MNVRLRNSTFKYQLCGGAGGGGTCWTEAFVGLGLTPGLQGLQNSNKGEHWQRFAFYI